MLDDESGGVEAYSQALESVQDPKLKEILQAIHEDETKHQAALQQWMKENGGGEEEGNGEDEETTPQTMMMRRQAMTATNHLTESRPTPSWTREWRMMRMGTISPTTSTKTKIPRVTS